MRKALGGVELVLVGVDDDVRLAVGRDRQEPRGDVAVVVELVGAVADTIVEILE